MVLGIGGKASGLVADYAHQPGLTEPSATQLWDYSRWKNHGTFKADGKPDWVKLPSGLWVMDFDGDSRITAVNHASLNLTGNITLIAWVRIDGGAGTYRPIVDKGCFSQDKAYVLWVHIDNKIWFKTIRDVPGITYSNDTVTEGQCYLVIGTSKSGEQKLYINGVLQAAEGTATGLITTTTTALYFGAAVAREYYHNGLLAPPRISSGVLGATKLGTGDGSIFKAERWWFGV